MITDQRLRAIRLKRMMLNNSVDAKSMGIEVRELMVRQREKGSVYETKGASHGATRE